MPGMAGIELLDKIKAINPAVTRILMSAFEIQEEQFQECNCVDKFLQKPILKSKSSMKFECSSKTQLDKNRKS